MHSMPICLYRKSLSRERYALSLWNKNQKCKTSNSKLQRAIADYTFVIYSQNINIDVNLNMHVATNKLSGTHQSKQPH